MPTQTIDLATGWNTIPVYDGGGGKRLASIAVLSVPGVTLDVLAVGRAAPFSDATLAQEMMFYEAAVVVGAGAGPAPGYQSNPAGGNGYESLSAALSPVSLGIKVAAPTTITVTTQFEYVIVQGITDFKPLEDAGYTLYDPLGIVASWSIVNGLITVATNAAIGSAFLISPLGAYPKDTAFQIFTRSREVINPASQIYVLYGVSGDLVASVDNYIGTGFIGEAWPDGRGGLIAGAQLATTNAIIDDVLGSLFLGSPYGDDQTTYGMVSASAKADQTVEGSSTYRYLTVYFLPTDRCIRIHNVVATAHTIGIYMEATVLRIPWKGQ